MKHVLFVLALIIVALIAIKLLFWTIGKVVVLAAIAAVIYIAFRMLIAKKRE
jgi:hypothetical protein